MDSNNKSLPNTSLVWDVCLGLNRLSVTILLCKLVHCFEVMAHEVIWRSLVF